MNHISNAPIDYPDAIAEDAIRSIFSTREHRIDPWPLYKKLREAKPAHYSPTIKSWVISRMADVKTVLWSPNSAIRHESRLAPGWRDHPSLSNMSDYFVLRDNPSHDEIRKTLSPQWTIKSIEPQESRVLSQISDPHASVSIAF